MALLLRTLLDTCSSDNSRSSCLEKRGKDGGGNHPFHELQHHPPTPQDSYQTDAVICLAYVLDVAAEMFDAILWQLLQLVLPLFQFLELLIQLPVGVLDAHVVVHDLFHHCSLPKIKGKPKEKKAKQAQVLL